MPFVCALQNLINRIDKDSIAALSNELFIIIEKTALELQEHMKNNKKKIITPDCSTSFLIFNILSDDLLSLQLNATRCKQLLESIDTDILDYYNYLFKQGNIDDDEFGKVYKGWLTLRTALRELDELRPVLIAHHQLDQDLNSFEKSANALQDKSAKSEATRYITDIRKLNSDYLRLYYWYRKDPRQIKKLSQKNKQYQETARIKHKKALKILATHRAPGWKRIGCKVILGISLVCTVSLAAIPKLIYSKLTTGKWTLFNDITRSHGYVNTINKSSSEIMRLTLRRKTTMCC